MRTYRQTVLFLKKFCPAKYPVSVRRVKMSQKLDGDCAFYDDHFRIRINRSLSETEAIDCVLHEFAHCHAWDKCVSDDHCNEWGKAYSRIYRAYLRDFLNISN